MTEETEEEREGAEEILVTNRVITGAMIEVMCPVTREVMIGIITEEETEVMIEAMTEGI